MKAYQKIGSDNMIEDYFLELVIKKHIIDREIQDTIKLIDESIIHPDYQILIKKILFGEKNLYLENWGTLEASLLDMVETMDIRGHEIEQYGVILGMMLQIIEEIFDVDDTLMNDFMLSEQREDVEHRLIILLKHIIDFIQSGLQEIITHTKHLDTAIVDGYIRKEFMVVKNSLLGYPRVILEGHGDQIREIKLQIDQIVVKIQEKKKNFARMRR